jgi:general secretion pathway protein G
MDYRMRKLHVKSKGMSLMELMIAVAIVGVLASIAYPSYQNYVYRVEVAEASTELRAIIDIIERFQVSQGRYPTQLSELNLSSELLEDPWGNTYQYLNLSTVKGNGKVRKNKSLKPINGYYDLYSVGRDGKSSSPLTAKASQDDVVVANDGAFIGLGSDYS